MAGKRNDRGEKAAEALRTYTSEEIRTVLTDREVEILRLRARNPGDPRPMTLKAIGKIFGVNRERVRAIVNASIRKLENHREALELERRQAANQARAIREGVDVDALPSRIVVNGSPRRLRDLRKMIQREESQ
ncbi:MAG TPA: sigma factor-like helix-turn-helix DNA-binding protein [Solirubrobacterales bacterium]|nr:sigma factor-like helix-turn-helix DNA-binding protein [Solirubrobacterales bacterium]